MTATLKYRGTKLLHTSASARFAMCPTSDGGGGGPEPAVHACVGAADLLPGAYAPKRFTVSVSGIVLCGNRWAAECGPLTWVVDPNGTFVCEENSPPENVVPLGPGRCSQCVWCHTLAPDVCQQYVVNYQRIISPLVTLVKQSNQHWTVNVTISVGPVLTRTGPACVTSCGYANVIGFGYDIGVGPIAPQLISASGTYPLGSCPVPAQIGALAGGTATISVNAGP